MTESGGQGRLRVRQIRSGIGYSTKQRATLSALGMGKVGRTREFPDNPEVRAMVGCIPHLVEIVGDDDGSGAGSR